MAIGYPFWFGVYDGVASMLMSALMFMFIIAGCMEHCTRHTVAGIYVVGSFGTQSAVAGTG